MTDARFEDGADRPLRLMAVEPSDLEVISTLTQDAVFPVTEMSWRPAERRFALLVNRFRWEDADFARSRARDFERVQSVLEVGDVKAIRSQGVDRSDKDVILSLLAMGWDDGEDGTGTLTLTLAGDGAIALDAECVNVRLTDVTRPYIAPSRKAPKHDQD